MSHAPSQPLLARLRVLSDLLENSEGDETDRPSPAIAGALSALEANANEWARWIESAELERRFLAAHPRARHYLEELESDRERLLAELREELGESRERELDEKRIAHLIRAWTHHVESIARIEVRAST